jgi:hypothetical protein
VFSVTQTVRRMATWPVGFFIAKNGRQPIDIKCQHPTSEETSPRETAWSFRLSVYFIQYPVSLTSLSTPAPQRRRRSGFTDKRRACRSLTVIVVRSSWHHVPNIHVLLSVGCSKVIETMARNSLHTE